MRRRELLASTLGLTALGGATVWGQNARRPNVVFFLVDDLGYKDIGAFGSSFYDTPNIDALCRRGMKFTDAYAACPVCSPTRASIQTGKYPARIQTTDYFGAPQPANWRRNTPTLPAPYNENLPKTEKTIAETFKGHGYSTFFAGKWHLGHEGSWPEDHGYDVNKGGWTRGGPYGGKKYFSPYGNPRLEDGPDGEHLPDRLATETVRFVESKKDQPFFAMLSFYSVHTPLIARDDLTNKYKAKKAQMEIEGPLFGDEPPRQVRQVQEHAIYAAMVEAMDLAVGKVVDGVRQAGLEDDTIFVFMSDNGGLSTSEGSPTSNLPLRAGKGWAYEGGVREPMFVVWPNRIKPRTVSQHPVTSTDFYPTLLELAGLPLEPEQHLDGVSFAPILRGSSIPQRPLYWHYPHHGNQGGTPNSAIRDGDWKLIRFYSSENYEELYNLVEDIGEQNNLIDERAEIAGALRSKLDRWLREVGALLPTPNPRYQPPAPPPVPADAADAKGFDVLIAGALKEHEGAYILDTKPNATAIALKRLERPVTNEAEFSVTLQSQVKELGNRYRNGFIVFGDGPARKNMVFAGVYLGGRRFYSIFEDGDQTVKSEAPLTAGPLSEFELTVQYNAREGVVVLKHGDKSLIRKLSRKLGPITHVGYGAIHTTVKFSAVELR